MTNDKESIHPLESEEQLSPDKLLRIREVADMLEICPNTVRSWADRGVLKSYRIGPRRDRRVPVSTVKELLAGR